MKRIKLFEAFVNEASKKKELESLISKIEAGTGRDAKIYKDSAFPAGDNKVVRVGNIKNNFISSKENGWYTTTNKTSIYYHPTHGVYICDYSTSHYDTRTGNIFMWTGGDDLETMIKICNKRSETKEKVNDLSNWERSEEYRRPLPWLK